MIKNSKIKVLLVAAFSILMCTCGVLCNTSRVVANDVSGNVAIGSWTFIQGGQYMPSEPGNEGYIKSVTMNGSDEVIDGWLRGSDSINQSQSSTQPSNGFSMNIENTGWDRNWSTPIVINPWSVMASTSFTGTIGHQYKVTFKANASNRKLAVVDFLGLDSAGSYSYVYGDDPIVGDDNLIEIRTHEKEYSYTFTNWVCDDKEIQVRFMLGAVAGEKDLKGNDFNLVEDIVYSGTVIISDLEIVDLTKANSPTEPEGVVVGKVGDNSALLAWNITDEQREKGQTFNIYVDGNLHASNMSNSYLLIDNLTEAVHKIKITGVINGVESEGVIRTIAIGNATTAEEVESVYVDLVGTQISTTVEGFRVIYSVEGRDKDIVEKGLIYGLGDYCDESDMVIGSTNEDIHNFVSTESGKSQNFLGENKAAYIMTMNFIKAKAFYEAPLYVRAYAKLRDNTVVYSNVESFTVYEISSYLYERGMMTNYVAHDYLYNNILSVVNREYERKDYDWIQTVVGF